MELDERSQKCVKVILKKWIGENREKLKDIATNFNDSDAISKSQRKKINKDAQNKLYGAAIDTLVAAICQHSESLWTVKIIEACSEEDFTGEGEMTNLLINFLHEDELLEKISYLILAWDELLNLEDKVFEILQSLLQDNVDFDKENNKWPSFLIVNCMTKYRDEVFEKLYPRLKEIVDEHRDIVKKEKEKLEREEQEQKKKYQEGQARLKADENRSGNDELGDSSKDPVQGDIPPKRQKIDKGKHNRKKKKKRIDEDKNTEAEAMSTDESAEEFTDARSHGSDEDIYAQDTADKEATGTKRMKESIPDISPAQEGVKESSTSRNKTEAEKRVKPSEQLKNGNNKDQPQAKTSTDAKRKNGKVTGDGGSGDKIEGSKREKEESQESEKKIATVKSIEEVKDLQKQSPDVAGIEFRLVSTMDTSRYKVCICTGFVYDWSPLPMSLHESKRYYHCFLPMPNEKGILYKYCLIIPNSVQIWERFSTCGTSLSNRYLSLNSDDFSDVVVHDVATFDRCFTPWEDDIAKNIIRHLPDFKQIKLSREKKRFSEYKLSYGREIFAWIHSIARGWRITDSYWSGSVNFGLIVSSLHDWLSEHQKSLREGNTDDKIRLIVSTLSFVIALHHERRTIYGRNMLTLIVSCLSTENLNEDEHELLYKKIMTEVESFPEASKIQLLDSVLQFIKQCSDLHQCLFLLPLYWLIADKGAIDKKQLIKRKVNQGKLLFKRSNLPQCDGLKWSGAREKFTRYEAQSSLKNASVRIAKISKLHPWIVGSYQYMLTPASLVELIKDREKNEIGNKFPVDVVFDQLLSGYYYKTKIDKIFEVSDYLLCELEKLQVNAEHKRFSADEAERNLEAAVNIIYELSSVIQEMCDKTTIATTSDNDNFMWCITMACQANKLARVLLASEVCKEKQVKLTDSLDKILTSVSKRICKCRFEEEQLDLWNSLACVEWLDKEFVTKWKNGISKEMSKKISNHWYSEEQFLEFYAEKLDKVDLDPVVESCFNDEAYSCTEKILRKHDGTKGRFSTFVGKVGRWIKTPRFITILSKLFQRELQKPKSENEYIPYDKQVLKFLLSWPFSVQFYDLFDGKKTWSSFPKDTRNEIERVSDSFALTSSLLQSGEIEVEQLELILQHREKFCELHKTMIVKMTGTSIDSRDQNRLNHILDHCERKLESFMLGRQYVQGFISACSKTDENEMQEVVVDVLELSALYKKNHSKEKLSSVAPDSVQRRESDISFYDLKYDWLKEFMIINFIKDSKVFQEMWHQAALQAKQDADDAGFDLRDQGLWRVKWKEALDDIWTTTKKEMIETVQSIDSGELELEVANDLFKRLDGNVAEIEKDLKLLYDYYELVTRKEEAEDHAQEPMQDDVPTEDENDEDVESSASDDTSSSDDESSDNEQPPPPPPAVLRKDSSEEDDERLAEEVYLPLENLELRVEQICSYYRLEKAKEAIDLLLDMKQKFGLQGDFKTIETQKEIAENSTNIPIHQLAHDQAIPSVCEIDKNNLTTLILFMAEEELIVWLKEKMTDINEVKVMCDLAMISAGESPYEVDQVSCLLSAVMGFAPLIFELNERSGLTELLAKCQQVWENIKADSKLHEKWKDTGTQLPWFKGIENFHGSVEKQSLTCAQDINERGIYTIQKKHNMQSVEDVVRLVIPAKTMNAPEDERQKMNLKELHDLQSKLMLIAGEAEKGQKDVNMFVDVLTAVEKLAQIFVQLVASGCMLFSEWSMTIACQDISNSTETNNLLLQITFTDDSYPLGGRGSLTDLQKLSTVLEEARRKWDDYIVTKRMKHYHLNEFNIQQITYLCKQLASLGPSIPDQVKTLLLSISNNLDIYVVKECLKDATKVLDEDQMNEEMEENQTQESDNRNVTELKKRAVRRLVADDEVSEDIAKAAVQAIGYEDEENCLNWSLEHQFDDDLIENLALEFDEEITDLPQSAESSPGNATPDVIKEKRNAVRKLMDDEEMDENIAKAAVQAEGYEDLSDCVTWVFENEFNRELVEELVAKFDKEAAFNHQDREAQVIMSVLYDRSSNTLRDVIDRLQQQTQTANSDNMIDSVNTICAGYYDETMVITLQDYLSIEHLGRFLQFLKERSNRTPPTRNLMPPLEPGKPNLIIRIENEILPTVLSLYLNDSEQPLPSTSEVLLCSEQTSADEVERFMRRAMLNSNEGGRMLFSLAFADKLSFNVSTETERIFSSLLQDKRTNENYQLVILLSKPQHYLTTCFDKYLVDGKWMKTKEEIASYLAKHLKVSDDSISATCVDPEHSMVKVVSSSRSGVGKSLHVKRLREELENRMRNRRWQRTTVRLLEKSLNPDYVIERLYKAADDIRNEDVMLVHLDLTPAVLSGIETFAFNLFVLGSIQDSRGKIWRRHKQHLYALEMTDFGMKGKSVFSVRHILNLLPCVKCFAPKEVMQRTARSVKYPLGEKWLPMDQTEFLSDVFQRPFQYLNRFEDRQDLDSFRYSTPLGTCVQCIQTLLNHCSMDDPSWAQLKHFASFLNYQLQHCENSIFCQKQIVGNILNGLKAFAVNFMIRMSQDFATPSLDISDESKSDRGDRVSEAPEGQGVFPQLRRKWEESNHPYIFFNEDGATMTFINVNISDKGDLLDKNGVISERGIIDKRLVQGLKLQNVSLDLNFDGFSREEKLRDLCLVMGIREVFDPDPTYELTTDNVLKILAIYMRFRCQIPVIIMGETGCGKTRMIEFMSRLKAGQVARCQASPGDGIAVGEDRVRNMMTLKIHGGITAADIHRSVGEAQEIAMVNRTRHNLSTILFYDEANTTEAIYAIKEVMCDLTIDGRSFKESQLQLVAACNPYKQLSKEAIKKLEDSGLGYRIRTSETTHLLGNIPMRTLVYRVVALPPSMQPFVWDFGQLGEDAERIYIEQMTKKLALKLDLDNDTVKSVNELLSESQSFMRLRRDECRYVSLRDVERCMIIFEWFHKHSGAIYTQIDDEIGKRYNRLNRDRPDITPSLRTLIQTVGVCYHASLDDRKPFRELVARILGLDELDVKEELSASQAVFLKNMKIDDNIAHNEALQENVFMITVCAETRIPLFLIGKPGSSKSLAKTIVMGNMQGTTSRSPLYKTLKQIHILSYQCSALTDAVGIAGVFKQCVQLQAKQDLNTYTAVVVLDEIGLAEDSPNMPLKVLHPLLECGSAESGSLTDVDNNKKVGFVGISNWALDPAKMNRGIFVTRNKPTKNDLLKTAKGIFENQKGKINENEHLLSILTSTYLEIYDNQSVEYFGLRDYYSLIKMIHARCVASEDMLTFPVVANAILRNFSGGRDSHFQRFQMKLSDLFGESVAVSVPIHKMITDNLKERDSRFLLLLTNQFSAVSLLGLCINNFQERVLVVFGSSFPGDHNYTEICRNINRIKVCMETGRTVVLLNMTDIHESLYDALNQHYVTFGGQKYVDLGLGGHRVKCRIADGFRLIVVEQKDKVYDEYPIPLINRLEKHHLDSKSLLTRDQERIAISLREWAKKFSKINNVDFTMKDAFTGAHEDTPSSVVLTAEGDVDRCKNVLLQSCAMDGIFRLPESELGTEIEDAQRIYIEEQVHDSLGHFLQSVMNKMGPGKVPLLEITSYSNILSEKDREEVERELELVKNSVMLLSLEQFRTEQEYSNKLDEFFKYCKKQNDRNDEVKSHAVLLVQCSQAQSHGQLIACAKYCLINKVHEFKNSEGDDLQMRSNVIVAFLLSTERESKIKSERESLVLQHTKESDIVYVDELRPTNRDIAPATHFYKKSLCEVLKQGKNELRREQAHSLVNIKSLLKDCVCEAVARVKDVVRSNEKREFKRIRYLTKLLSENDCISFAFQSIFLQKMIEMYREREEERAGGAFNDWIVEEACNRESLQEGGTFRKTLWLCLKRHVAKLLAYVTSFVDRSNNLDILDCKVNWKVEMWLRIFEVIEMSWSAIGGAQEFHMKNPKHLRSVAPCNIPFAFYLHEFFNKQWENLDKQNNMDKENILSKLFRSSRMHPIFASAFTNSSIIIPAMKQYVLDLVKEFYVPGSKKEDRITEYNLIEKILRDLVLKKYQVARREDDFQHGDEISLIFLTFKQIERFLGQLSQIIRACPKILARSEKWIASQNQSEMFCIHILALKDVLDLLKEMADRINVPRDCKEWSRMSALIKPLLLSVLDSLDDVGNHEERTKIQKTWNPLSLLDLLILQLLPSSSQVEKFEKYLAVIAPDVKLLWKGCLRADLQSQQFLKIISNVLRKCYEDIRLKIMLFWQQDVNCKHCRKRVKEPVIFPCGHFTCSQCALTMQAASEDGAIKCPNCQQTVSADFDLRPTDLSKTQEEEVARFHFNCTSFFLEYLQRFCFVGASNSMQTQVDMVLRELVLLQDVKSKEVQRAGLDLNINMRSSVLRILLNFSSKFVNENMNAFFERRARNLNREHLKDVVIVVLKCYEQNFLLKRMKHEEKERDSIKECELALGSLWRKILVEGGTMAKMELMRAVAGIRCAMQEFANCIKDSFKEEVDETREVYEQREKFTAFAREICVAEDTHLLKEYLVKVGCGKHGMQWFDCLTQHDKFKELIPPLLMQAAKDKKTDHWSLLGKSYSETKSSLYKTSPDQLTESVSALFQRNPPSRRLAGILAAVTWSQEQDEDEKEIVRKKLKKQQQSAFYHFLANVNTALIPALAGVRGITDQQAHILYQLVTVTAATVTAGKYMMEGFNFLAMQASKVELMYLPAMPEHLYFAMPTEYRAQGYHSVYVCPKGHMYTIGNCTRPVVESTCPTCKSAIGGKSYHLAQGNASIKMEETSQTGYMLRKDQTSMAHPADRISKQGAAAVQFIVHASMMIGLGTVNAAVISRMLGFPNKAISQEYLVQQLLMNLQDLSTSLGRNIDHTIFIMHKILLQILQNEVHGPPPGDWSSMAKRKDWEERFRQHYLLPIFQNLDFVVVEAENAMNEAEDLCSGALYRLVHDIPVRPEPNTTDLKWTDPMLWGVIEHSSSNHLVQTLADSKDTHKGEVLQIILQTADLHLIKHLESVLQLQYALILKYQNNLDLEESELITFEEFLRNGEHAYELQIQEYIRTWNQVYPAIQAKIASDRKPDEYFIPMSMNSPISMALPASRGRGQCAKLLAEHLIDIQNDFLTTCKQVLKASDSIREVDVDQLTHSHYVCIDKQKDLLPLIQMHTKYTITTDKNVRHHHITYNIDALEKQTREKFVMYKRLISKNTLHLMRYAQDIGIGSEWEKVLTNTKQQTLPSKLAQDVDRNVSRVPSADVCEGVRTLTQAISFLAKAKEDGKKSLCEYLERDLLLSASRTSVIPKSAPIENTISLYLRLSWHKSVNFALRGLDPYKDALSNKKQEAIEDEDILQQLKEAFQHSDVIKLQQKVNEILVRIPEYNPEWSLSEIFPDHDFLDEHDDDDSWYSRIPEDVCFKHVAHLFSLAVKFTNKA